MKARYVFIGALSVLTACASTKPPSELQDARTAMANANQNQTARLDPADLHVAQETLNRAEASFNEDGANERTQDLAYTAERQVRIAEARARTTGILNEKAATLARIEKDRVAALARAKQNLSQTKEQLEQTEQARQAEEQRRMDAEKRAKKAASDLAQVAKVKQDQDRLVITLSGSVLFASGKSALLPSAQRRLTEVAKTLSEQDKTSKIDVMGYTDSTGSATMNDELSRQRAESVREFLVTHGIAGDRVEAKGMGESQPVATNETPEGRASNRRVEIVVEPPTKTK